MIRFDSGAYRQRLLRAQIHDAEISDNAVPADATSFEKLLEKNERDNRKALNEMDDIIIDLQKWREERETIVDLDNASTNKDFSRSNDDGFYPSNVEQRLIKKLKNIFEETKTSFDNNQEITSTEKSPESDLPGEDVSSTVKYTNSDNKKSQESLLQLITDSKRNGNLRSINLDSTEVAENNDRKKYYRSDHEFAKMITVLGAQHGHGSGKLAKAKRNAGLSDNHVNNSYSPEQCQGNEQLQLLYRILLNNHNIRGLIKNNGSYGEKKGSNNQRSEDTHTNDCGFESCRTLSSSFDTFNLILDPSRSESSSKPRVLPGNDELLKHIQGDKCEELHWEVVRHLRREENNFSKKEQEVLESGAELQSEVAELAVSLNDLTSDLNRLLSL